DIDTYHDAMGDDDDIDICSVDSKNDDEVDVWSVELKKHFVGNFSMAVSQANENIEDRCQVEAFKDATFVGIYDGHGGQEAADYVLNHLFKHFIEHIIKAKVMSEAAIRYAIAATEQGFTEVVRDAIETQPFMASVGTSCLIGVIWRDTIYVANLGDSQVVLGCNGSPPLSDSGSMQAYSLSLVHDINELNIKKELLDTHFYDFTTGNDWLQLIKNRIQVSRSVGDAYLKYPELARPNIPISKALLTTEPTTQILFLRGRDKFLIFGSGGLWKHISKDEAVEFVHNHPSKGIAKRLVKEAQRRAAEGVDISCEEVKKAAVGEERAQIHDDITVVIIFVDYEKLCKESSAEFCESIVCFSNKASQSEFSQLENLAGHDRIPAAETKSAIKY
ncbi:putative protein phosphatase 2C 43, partial [Bienertia sinuspersici]